MAWQWASRESGKEKIKQKKNEQKGMAVTIRSQGRGRENIKKNPTSSLFYLDRPRHIFI
jgi:hypothetical protein